MQRSLSARINPTRMSLFTFSSQMSIFRFAQGRSQHKSYCTLTVTSTVSKFLRTHFIYPNKCLLEFSDEIFITHDILLHVFSSIEPELCKFVFLAKIVWSKFMLPWLTQNLKYTSRITMWRSFLPHFSRTWRNS